MKKKKLVQISLGILLAVVLAVFSTMVAFADPEDDPQINEPEQPAATENVDPVYTDPVYTEPEVTYAPETQYAEPTTAYQEQTEYVPQTEAEQVHTEAETKQAVQNADTQQTTTEFVAPTVAKTVSDKKYTTNYTFGIFSWICVIVGVIVILSALVSNKISGLRASRRV